MRNLPLSIHHRLPKRLPYSLGFSKYALGFHGAEYVYVGDSPSLQITGKIAVEMVGKPRVRGNMWVGKYTTEISTYNIYDGGDPYGWIFRLYSADASHHSVFSYCPIATGKLYHVFGIYDLAEMRIYVNGELKNAIPLTTNLDPVVGGHFSVGARYKAEGVIDGYVDGDIVFVRVYDDRLFDWLTSKGWSIDDLVTYNLLNYHNPIREGLVLWLPFEEGLGTIAYDESGSANDGTIYGATWEKLKMWELRAEVGI